MLLHGEDGPQRARRDGLKAGVQHRVLQPRVVPDSITTAKFAGLGFLGFARLVALTAQRAGVARFANHRTFACIAFNDE